MTGQTVDVLILGAGWSSTFLVPLLQEKQVSYASTTRDGRGDSIQFTFDPESDDGRPFEALPDAKCIVIVFPIYNPGGSERLVKLYRQSRRVSSVSIEKAETRFIQLGSTGIWDGGPTVLSEEKKQPSTHIDRHSPINLGNKRAAAEEELLKLSGHESVRTTVLNLCGLWGGERSMRRYVSRIAGTKEQLRNKGSIHMIHGIDVARAILATAQAKTEVYGQRWLITDLRVYDWYDLASKFGDAGIEGGSGKPATGPQTQWVVELMDEQGLKSLPRTPEQLGRAMTSVDFWQAVGMWPVMGGQLE